MDNQFDSSTKVVIDLFNRQYSQFDDTIKRLMDANDKAHDQLFLKIESLFDGQQDIKDEIHEINSTQKIMLHNYEAQQKEVEGIKENVQTLTDRVDAIEEDHKKKKHVWSLGAKILATAVAISALIGWLLKLLNIF